jgi:hypothetical protein
MAAKPRHLHRLLASLYPVLRWRIEAAISSMRRRCYALLSVLMNTLMPGPSAMRIRVQSTPRGTVTPVFRDLTWYFKFATSVPLAVFRSALPRSECMKTSFIIRKLIKANI